MKEILLAAIAKALIKLARKLSKDGYEMAKVELLKREIEERYAPDLPKK